MPRERFIALAISHAYSSYRDVLKGISRFAEHHPDWRFVSCSPHPNHRTRVVLKQAEAVISGVHNREYCDFLLSTGVPIVNVSSLVEGLPIPRIGIDNHAVGRLAADHFQQRHLRSFAFVGHQKFLFSILRENGFRSALARSSHPLQVYHSHKPHDFLECVLSLEPAVCRWLQSLPRPTGILMPNDLWAVELMQICHEIGLRVPEDIAVLGVDNDDLFSAIARPSLSSVILPAEPVGYRAAAEVERILEGKQNGLQDDILLPPVEIAVRRSTDVLAIDNPDVVAALRFIRENCHRPLQVSDVLKEVPVSRRWLERRVYETLGITLGAEIRRTRLQQAKRLLAETDLSIASVARQSGFSDWRHLEAAFRQNEKCTPTQFRALMTGESVSRRSGPRHESGS